MELVQSSIQTRTVMRLITQGGLPSVSLRFSYPVCDPAEYTYAYLNGRLIAFVRPEYRHFRCDLKRTIGLQVTTNTNNIGKSEAGFEDIAFATTSVEQFQRMFTVDLLS